MESVRPLTATLGANKKRYRQRRKSIMQPASEKPPPPTAVLMQLLFGKQIPCAVNDALTSSPSSVVAEPLQEF
jgi:hypothetical protein